MNLQLILSYLEHTSKIITLIALVFVLHACTSKEDVVDPAVQMSKLTENDSQVAPRVVNMATIAKPLPSITIKADKYMINATDIKDRTPPNTPIWERCLFGSNQSWMWVKCVEQ